MQIGLIAAKLQIYYQTSFTPICLANPVCFLLINICFAAYGRFYARCFV